MMQNLVVVSKFVGLGPKVCRMLLKSSNNIEYFDPLFNLLDTEQMLITLLSYKPSTV